MGDWDRPQSTADELSAILLLDVYLTLGYERSSGADVMNQWPLRLRFAAFARW